MMAHTHLAFGLLFGLLSLSFIHPANKYVFLGIAIFSSLLPDLDHPQSKLGRKLFVSKIFNVFFGHRGFFHAVWIPIAAWLILSLGFGISYGSAVFVGYFAHLFSDGLTKAGVNLIHPLKQLRMQGFIETGGIAEHLTFFAVVVVSIILIVS
ncbi:metal-dependent hydrolase [Candidatus Woesearchaeota archaeon]|nr:metal-dependent hydrolase [Candidatus Woesearchaeota archaeon]